MIMDLNNTTVVKPVKCPVCSSVNPYIAKKCAKCNTDLVIFKAEADQEIIEENIVSKQ